MAQQQLPLVVWVQVAAWTAWQQQRHSLAPRQRSGGFFWQGGGTGGLREVRLRLCAGKATGVLVALSREHRAFQIKRYCGRQAVMMGNDSRLQHCEGTMAAPGSRTGI